MAKGVSSKDYQASEAEKTSAGIAQSEYQRFKTTYAPLLKKRAEDTQTDAIKTSLRGRANADTMQALTSKLSLDKVESPSASGDVAQAYTGQLGEADKIAREYQNNQGVDILGRARQQAGTAQEGLAQLSRLGTSSALARAQAKAEVAQSKWNAAAQIGSTVIGQGMENLSQKDANGKSDFWTPGVQQPGTTPDGKPIYKPAASWEQRLEAGLGRSF